jgi:Vault protein inter-alpha-trypsin domain
MDRIDRIKQRESKLFLYPVHPVHPVNSFLPFKLNHYREEAFNGNQERDLPDEESISMSEQAQEPKTQRWGLLILFAGIILPSISIAVETITHICAENFFDPIPTVWHVLLVIFVPLAHFQVWLADRKGSTQHGTTLGIANAIAIGISLFYSIIYLPILPLALVALIFYGMGLLPMAPILSLIFGIILRRRLRRIASQGFAVKVGGLAFGLSLVVAAIVLIELPATLTRTGLKMAASESPERSARGIRLLREWGNRDYLLRACYNRTGRAIDPVGFLFSLDNPVSTEEARKIYYRVTGETFNTSIPPERVGGHFVPQDRLDFDPDQGGTVIAGKVKGLALSASRIDGSLDADAALGYLEWTLVFKNDSDRQQEARAQVRLPPGAVVSRLTLWVDGQEREAAFAGRDQTRGAYQQVVSRRRDPVLVTTSGRDRILVQCFPVPPKGGEMKIRFGITTPLILEDKSRARLSLPYILDRNFRIPDQVSHAVWIESKSALSAASQSLQTEQPRANLHAARGAVGDAELSERGVSLLSPRASEVTESWTRDPFKTSGEIVRGRIQEKSLPVRSKIILVLDTSRRMHDASKEVGNALKSLPPDIEVKLLPADGNGVYETGASRNLLSGKPEGIAAMIERATFEGGADNVPPLLKAWDIAAGDPQGSAIVWVHGPQPLLIQPTEELRQRWERRTDGPLLYSVQVGNGPDRIEEALDGIGSIEAVPRNGSLRSDLERLFAELTGRARPMEFVRAGETPGQPASSSPAVKETSAHLARLWAHDEVQRLIKTREKDWEDQARKLATSYQLVTPVSGAVVLETQEQYRQAGLQAVDPGTVPTIPEPEMILLAAVVAAVLLFTLYRKRFHAQHQSRRAV